jgi:tetratricopeptide (TPR) repeat protein
MKPTILASAAVLSLLAAGSAGAAVTVLGSSLAEDCAQAAFHGKSDNTALEICNQALQEGVLGSRDEAGTYVNRGVILMTRRDYDHALADFRHAISIVPSMGESWVNLGAVEVAEKRYQDGVTDISKGLDLGIQEPAKAHYNRALAYEGLDDETNAYRDYEAALTLDPNWDLPKQELLRFTVIQR